MAKYKIKLEIDITTRNSTVVNFDEEQVFRPPTEREYARIIASDLERRLLAGNNFVTAAAVKISH